LKAGAENPDVDVLAAVRRIAVGTTHESKLEAGRLALAAYAPEPLVDWEAIVGGPKPGAPRGIYRL
jgi:hypothetical protein